MIIFMIHGGLFRNMVAYMGFNGFNVYEYNQKDLSQPNPCFFFRDLYNNNEKRKYYGN